MNRKSIYLGGLFFAFHSFLIIYINSSYLGGYFSAGALSTLYIIGSIVNILLLVNVSKLIRRFGSTNIILSSIILEFIAIAGLAFVREIFFVGLFFIIHQTVISMILFILDIFLESSTELERTGSIRALYLTISNGVLVVSPALVSLMLGFGNFGFVYMISSLFLIPLFFLIQKNFKHFADATHTHTKITETVRELLSRRNVRRIMVAHLILECFYAWMVVYMPLYLYKFVGFSWQQIGVLFTIMLLPFVLFEIPAGTIGDRKLGEKEILILGFIICAASTAIIPFISGANFALWAVVLFATRVGASLIEITTESYFFKQVNSSNPDIISFFRATRPLSYIIIPIIIVIALSALEFRYTFFILALIMLFGVRMSLLLKDTK